MDCTAVLRLAPGVTVRLVVSDRGIRRLEFADASASVHRSAPNPERERGDSRPEGVLAEADRQLREYFSGHRRQFELPLDLEGTEFQRRVWAAVSAIPYGQTRNYAQIAGSVGSPQAVRAVGAANGANPVAIIVPCHRVVASGGGMGGYGGGVDLKRRLLALEAGQVFW